VQFSETQAAEYFGYNRLLVATARAAGAINTPISPIVTNNETGPMPLSMFDLSDGVMRFVQLGMTDTINREDRCFIEQKSLFNPNQTETLFLTGLALNLQAGATLRVDWSYQGDVVHQTSWTAPEFQEGDCIAMELNPSNAAFSPGNWTATLYVDGNPLDPIPFTLDVN
jgi:hypothetical protein